MKILGIEYTKREFIFLIIMLIMAIGFFLSTYAHEADIKGLRTTTAEAIQKFNDCNNGYMKMTEQNGQFISNLTIKDFK